MSQNMPDNDRNQKERRVSKRFPLTFYVSYNDPETKIKQTGVYETYKDISLSGMYFKVRKSLTVDTLLDIDITIPGFSRSFRIKSKVIRSIKQDDGNYNVGIKFQEISPEDKKELTEFLNSFDF